MKQIENVLTTLGEAENLAFTVVKKEYLKNLFYPEQFYPDLDWDQIDTEHFMDYLVGVALGYNYSFKSSLLTVLAHLIEPGDDICIRLNADTETSFEETRIVIKANSVLAGMVTHIDSNLQLFSMYYSYFPISNLALASTHITKIIPGEPSLVETYRNGVQKLKENYQDGYANWTIGGRLTDGGVPEGADELWVDEPTGNPDVGQAPLQDETF